MDTVTESKWRLITSAGGIGVIHRNLNNKKQAREVLKLKEKSHCWCSSGHK